MKKLLLTLSFIIGITTVSLAQSPIDKVSICKSSKVIYQINDKHNEHNVSGEWQDTEVEIVLFWQTGTIIIFSNDKQTYNFVEAVIDAKKTTTGELFSIWKMTDSRGVVCVIHIILDPKDMTNNYLRVNYSDASWEYKFEILENR